MPDNHQSLDDILEQARKSADEPLGKRREAPPAPPVTATPAAVPLPDNPARGVLRLGAVIGGASIVMCLVITLITVGMIAGIFAVVRTAMTSNEPYQDGLAAAQADPQVIAALGEPIEAGWWVIGSIETSGLSGQADLTVPIHGPDGKGRLYIGGRRQNGVWEYYTLSVEIIDTGELITLND